MISIFFRTPLKGNYSITTKITDVDEINLAIIKLVSYKLIMLLFNILYIIFIYLNFFLIINNFKTKTLYLMVKKLDTFYANTKRLGL